MVKQLESVAAKQLKLLAHSDRKIEKLEKQISHYKCEVKPKILKTCRFVIHHDSYQSCGGM